jgi:hypothetical protein
LPAVAAAPPPPALEVSEFRGRVLLPDFTGRSRSEVSQLSSKNGLRVELAGDGVAVRQDPPPGSIVDAGHEVVRVQFRAAGRS